ncbi:YciI family protein [Flaviflexus huanghaiensis]|uniref:YciI family protein n=1 Tax=Flaviflexus huanghaiensis TaxID=1111473 RepID=UPI0015FA0989|nr:YciI family protein [Flaviflexus huanghaiensis]
MPTFLVSFPSRAMEGTDIEARAEESHAVVREARDAGVWIFGGAIDESFPPVLVEGDGAVTRGTYPETAAIDGGYAIIDAPTIEEGLSWAAKIAEACRCAQEVRLFYDDPES